MIRIVAAAAFVALSSLQAEARGLKLRVPSPPTQQIDKHTIPVMPGIGQAYRNRSDCGASPKRPCTSEEGRGVAKPSR